MKDPHRTASSESPARGTEATFGPPYQTRYVWFAVVLLALVNACSYMDRMVLAVLAPSIKNDLQLSDTELGILVGFAFAIFYAACSVPIARWADHGVRRNIISLAVGVWSAMTVLSGAAQNFWHMLLARIGVGAGEAGAFAPGASVLCDYVPPHGRSMILALHTGGNGVGVLLGMALVGWLGESIGWRWTFVVLGAPGLALALIVRFTLREPLRGGYDAPTPRGTKNSFSETLGFLWRTRTYRAIFLFIAANGFFQQGLVQWWPSFYGRIHGMSMASAGLYLGVAIGVFGIAGLLIGGMLANKVARHNPSKPLVIGAIATALTIPAALVSLFLPSWGWSMALVFATGLLWSVSLGPAFAAQYNVVRPHMRATAGAVSLFASSVIGAGLGPFCVGLISDLLAPTYGVESLRYALLAPIIAAPIMCLMLMAGARSLPEEMQARADDSSVRQGERDDL